MANENKDVLRVHDTPANLFANLKDLMFGYDTTNNRWASKLSGGSMKYVSDDTQQVLIAGTQTITGLKTFTQNVIMTADKLLTLDQVGGLKLKDTDKYAISDDDSADNGYQYDELFNVFGGKLAVQDRGTAVASFDIISNGTFASDTKWTKTSGFTIGSGTLNFAHSDGTDDVTQGLSDMGAERIMPDTWYKMEYDITASAGTPTVEISTSTAVTAVAIDLTVATGKVLYFKSKENAMASFKIDVTASIAGNSFSLDNLKLGKVPGFVEGTAFGPAGSVGITGRGDIQSTDNTVSSDRSGYFKGPIASLSGLQFDSLGAGRFTSSLDIGGEQHNAVAGQEKWMSGPRMSINVRQSVTTSGAVTGDMDFELALASNDIMSTFLVFINGLKDDQTIGVGMIYMVVVRDNSGTLSIVGTPVQVGKIDDFTDTSVAFSISGDNLRVKVTGSAGDDIDWTSQYIGHGALFGQRIVL